MTESNCVSCTQHFPYTYIYFKIPWGKKGDEGVMGRETVHDQNKTAPQNGLRPTS